MDVPEDLGDHSCMGHDSDALSIVPASDLGDAVQAPGAKFRIALASGPAEIWILLRKVSLPMLAVSVPYIIQQLAFQLAAADFLEHGRISDWQTGVLLDLGCCVRGSPQGT
nr:hypothetical protein [Steroidobacter gossypii]